MTFKKLVSLRETRVKRLVDEAKDMEKETKATEQRNLREQILKK